MLALALVVAAAQTPADALWSGDSRYVRFGFTNMDSATTSVVHTVTLDTQTGNFDDQQAGESNCMFGDADKADVLAKQCDAARKKRASEAKKSDDSWKKAHNAVASKWDPSSHGARVDITADKSGAKFHLALGEHPPRDKELDGSIDDHGTVGASWSPDGQWVLCFAQGDQQDAEFAILPGVAKVDLLDAGAGDVKPAAAALTNLGWTPAHRGKSKSPHATTEIFYAVGFENDAKAIAAGLGLDASVAKPLTWATPYAITVALAR